MTTLSMTNRLFNVDGRATDNVLTPRSLFEALTIRFDLDVAASVDGDFVPADRRFTVEDDGLIQPWSGRVWMNPPYSKPQPWVDKFIQHSHGIALLPISRSHWQIRLWQEADGICLMDHLFSFHDHSSFPFQVHLAAFGEECVEALSRLGRVRR